MGLAFPGMGVQQHFSRQETVLVPSFVLCHHQKHKGVNKWPFDLFLPALSGGSEGGEGVKQLTVTGEMTTTPPPRVHSPFPVIESFRHLGLVFLAEDKATKGYTLLQTLVRCRDPDLSQQ